MNQYLIALLIVFFGTSTARAQWAVQFPGGTRNTHTFTVSPQASDLIYSFGNDMIVFDTASDTWRINDDYTHTFPFTSEQRTILSPNEFSDVFFITEQKGFVAIRSSIVRTVNGGADWEVVVELPSNHHYFTNLYFVNEQVGYAVGTYGKVYKTTDGGDTWQNKAGSWSQGSVPYIRFSEVVFSDEMNGMVVGYQAEDIQSNIGSFKAIIEETTDGGDTWHEIQVLPGTGESDHHYAKLQQLPGDVVYLILSNRNYLLPGDLLLRSADGGQTWAGIALPTAFGLVIRDMYWFDADHGLLAGSDSGFGEEDNIFVTDDGGATWETITLDVWPHKSLTQTYAYSMAFQGDEGILTGAHGSQVHTEDRGKTWTTLVYPHPDLKDISIVDDEHGFAVGNAGLILKKEIDSWRTIAPPAATDYRQVDFADAEHGALRDLSGKIYATENGGNDWTRLIGNYDSLALDMTFANGDLYILMRWAKSKLLLLKTRGTGGQFEVTTVDNNITTAISPVGSLQITQYNQWFVSYGSNLYASENAGQTWSVKDMPAKYEYHNRFFFINNNQGVLTDGITIWKTSDKGTTWTEGTLDAAIQQYDLYSISGFDLMNCNEGTKIVGRGWGLLEGEYTRSFIIESGDLGDTWTLTEVPFGQETSVTAINGWSIVDNTLYLAGSGGTITTYTCQPGPGGPVTDISETPLFNAHAFQVYPIPAGDQLTIRAMKEFANVEVKLSITDSQGRTIHTGYIQAEQGNVFQVDVSGFLPGMYFLYLQNAGTYEVHKFLKM